MIVSGTNISYFAFPKCASELVRAQLKLKPNNKFIYNDWMACDINYCHANPKKYVTYLENQEDTPEYIYFTVVRNTFERLVSAWSYLRKCAITVAYHPILKWRSTVQNQIFKDMTFDEFIKRIYENRNNFDVLPMCWMYMPFDKYFDGVHEKVKVFQISELDKLADFLQAHNIPFDYSKKINTTVHEHYSKYFTPELIDMVKEVYKWEIDKFEYKYETFAT